MTTTTATAALPADVEALMRGLRLPHARAIAADVLATARAQRWDPTEVIKALLTEEAAGRARSMLAARRKAAEGLYRIVEAAYERRSVAISSNLHPSGFDELMPKTLATATVDRLLHHAHLCQTSGDSVRLAQALHGKGVKPLT